MKFPEHQLAHKYLDGLKGIEIGASAHNPFNIPDCIYVDYSDDMNTVFKQEEFELCGEKQKVDVVAFAQDLPFESESLDYVLSSHVIEHCWDVFGTIEEWFRVLRPGGYIFMIIPHKERTFDKDRPRTLYQELVSRQFVDSPLRDDPGHHHSVWVLEDWLEICTKQKWNLVEYEDPDSKVNNGFTIVIQK